MGKVPVLALCVYLFSMYVFIFRQGLSGFILNGEAYGDAKDEDAQAHKKNVDRTVGNALEQAPIFLAALTIFSFLVDAKVGGILAFVYSSFPHCRATSLLSTWSFQFSSQHCEQSR